jgi:hypothetical protein
LIGFGRRVTVQANRGGFSAFAVSRDSESVQREDEVPSAPLDAFDAFEQALGLGEPVGGQDDPETVELIAEGERLRQYCPA